MIAREFRAVREGESTGRIRAGIGQKKGPVTERSRALVISGLSPAQMPGLNQQAGRMPNS
jgi:hypothetical protein